MTKHAKMSAIFRLPLDIRTLNTQTDVTEADGRQLKYFTGDDRDEKAFAIARAVNSHDDLLRHVKALVHEAGRRGGDFDKLLPPMLQCDAVHFAMVDYCAVTFQTVDVAFDIEHAVDERGRPLKRGEVPESYLCIGGPYAGRYVATFQNHPTFKVVERPASFEAEGAVLDVVDGIAPVRTITYTRQSIPGGFYWSAEGVTEAEVYAALLAAYAAQFKPKAAG